MLRRTLSSLLFASLWMTQPLIAQSPSAPTAKALFAQEPYILQQATTIYSYRADGTGYRERTIAVKIQSDAALRSFGVLSIPFASASEHVDLHYARVRHPDGSVTETPLTGALEQAAPVTREAPFYSDLKEKQLPITGLRSGDTLEWQARILRTVAEAPNQFWGQDVFITEGIILSEDVELHVPAAAHIILWTNPADGTAPSDTITSGERVIHWHHANLKPTVGPEAEAAKKTADAHILTAAEETDITDGKLPSLAFSTFADWAAVGAWYRSLAAPRAVPDDIIRAKAAELTSGLTTDDAKANALYNYVSTQIRYIGVSFGIGRYQPHSADDVLSNQYGDCKDKHTLLSALLAAVNIPSDAVLISPDIRFNPDVPSPQAFNHLITRAHINGQAVWLDTTAEIAPWRVLFITLRDKSALVIPPNAAASILHTDPNLPFPATENWESIGALDANGVSDSHIKLTLHGDTELVFRTVLRQVSPAQYGAFLDKLLPGLGYGGTGSHFETSRPDDTSTPLTFAFDYHREKAGDWDNLRTIAQLEPLGLPYIDEAKPPTSSLILGVLRTVTAAAQMKLPAGWTAQLPEAVHAKSPYATLDATFRLKDGIVFSERRLVVLQKKVPVSDWKTYKKFQDAASINSDPYIQLVRASFPGAGAAPEGPSSRDDNAEAANLIRQADEATRSFQTDKALALLDKAKALNPQQRGLWGSYGARAYGLGIVTEAIADYRKELLYHPDNTWVYIPLADELARNGKVDEAIEACRKGVALDPSNTGIQGTLVYLLMRQNRNEEAATAGLAALKVVDNDDKGRPRLIITTAQAQTLAGKNNDAAVLLSGLLKTTDDSGTRNDAAYALAETGLELSTARTASYNSLESLGAETRAWTLDESPDTLKRKSNLLAAAWDTYGYILFREDRLPEARSFIEASWHNRQSAEVGLHLGDILLAQGDAPAAIAVYQFARGLVPSVQNNSAAKVLADKIDAGLVRAWKVPDTNRPRNSPPSRIDSRSDSQKVRTLNLGPNGGLHGSGEFRLLLFNGKVDAFRNLGTGSLTNAGTFLTASKAFAPLTPATSDAKIVVTGFINCQATTCDFVIEP